MKIVNDRSSPQQKAHLKKLSSVLLEIGGKDVLIMGHEHHAEEILERGRLFSLETMRQLRGEHEQCHRETAEAIWRDPSLRAVTGFRLASDGLWFQHSWLYKNGRVIEPQERHGDFYYGYIMGRLEAVFFVRTEIPNLPEDEWMKLISAAHAG